MNYSFYEGRAKHPALEGKLSMQFLKNIKSLPKSSLLKASGLVILFCVSSAFLFYNALKFPLPVAYAGMYTMMAEQIANNGFSIPAQVPYYGPGGIPFAYPPAAFYVMAFFLKLNISAITYARFMPAIFSLLALIPLYLLVKDLTNSDLSAALAVTYAAFSPSLYLAHTMAAGIVRALAFLFMLCGFYFLQKTLREGRYIFAALAGIFFGLTTLTHLFYALFFALWAICWAILSFKQNLWKPFTVAAVAALIVISPWLYMVISRYGITTLMNTFASHDNTSMIGLVSQPKLLLIWMLTKFGTMAITPFPFILIILGFIYSILNRQFGIPLTLLASLLALSAEGDRFIILSAAILFGTSSLVFKKWLRKANWLSLVFITVFGVASFQLANFGLQQINKMPPSLHQSGFEVAHYVQKNTLPNTRYLFIAGQSEAEWFPYLLQREPIVSKWGSEWLGTYNQQRSLQAAVIYCGNLQSVDCLKHLRLKINPTDILITRKAEKNLAIELESFSACKKLASIGRYIIWKAQCLAP